VKRIDASATLGQRTEVLGLIFRKDPSRYANEYFRINSAQAPITDSFPLSKPSSIANSVIAQGPGP